MFFLSLYIHISFLSLSPIRLVDQQTTEITPWSVYQKPLKYSFDFHILLKFSHLSHSLILIPISFRHHSFLIHFFFIYFTGCYYIVECVRTFVMVLMLLSMIPLCCWRHFILHPISLCSSYYSANLINILFIYILLQIPILLSPPSNHQPSTSNFAQPEWLSGGGGNKRRRKKEIEVIAILCVKRSMKCFTVLH